MPVPTSKVLADLVALGEQGTPGIPSSLQDSPRESLIHQWGFETWKQLAKSLSEPHLRNLIRGLVLYSRAKNRSLGGSVSPVIDLYADYVERFPEGEPALTGWVVDNRINPYEPFGTIAHREARSQTEFSLLSEKRAKVAQQKQADDQEARRVRESTKATQRLANAVRRGDLKAIKVLLEKGADPKKALGHPRSLQQLAAENQRLAVLEFLRERGID